MSISEKFELTLEYAIDPSVKKRRRILTLCAGGILFLLSICAVFLSSSGAVLLLSAFGLFPTGLLVLYLSLRPRSLEGMMVLIMGFIIGLLLYPTILEHKIEEILVQEFQGEEILHKELGTALVRAGGHCEIVDYHLRYGIEDLVQNITYVSDCEKSS